jgi:hypothetical protein
MPRAARNGMGEDVERDDRARRVGLNVKFKL